MALKLSVIHPTSKETFVSAELPGFSSRVPDLEVQQQLLSQTFELARCALAATGVEVKQELIGVAAFDSLQAGKSVLVVHEYGVLNG